MLVDPLQIPTTDWMIAQEDQHRRAVPTTPGVTESQIIHEWLSPLRAAVRLLYVLPARWSRQGLVVPLLSVVRWLQGRLTLYDKSNQYPPLALVGVS